MTTVLFLTYRMKLGYGVDVVVHQVSQWLKQRGYRVVVGCLESEPEFKGAEIMHIRPTASEVRQLAKSVGAKVIVAHTSPFFELLPELQNDFPCWAWEHGDPTPALFDADRADRQRIKDRKRAIYPRLSGVVAISEFIKQDIGYSAAKVIYNGCDHVPAAESKGQQEVLAGEMRPLRVGTLMRLGEGEAFYKGNALFRRFSSELRRSEPNVDMCVMGRGTEADAQPFRDIGLTVHLNASDADKWRYLRELDVFVSFSLWEGFNLPLVEAQALGTVGLAFDTGAHPEVTPFVLGNVEDALALVRAYSENRYLLLRHSQVSWRFVRQRFGWARCAAAFERCVVNASNIPERAKGNGAATRKQ